MWGQIILCLFSASVLLPVDAWSGSSSQLCSSTRWVCQRVWGCRMGTWRACCYWGWVTRTVLVRDYYCCSGWRHNGNQVCNIPICRYNCGGNGDCYAPNKCRCNVGYTGTYCIDEAACSYTKPCYPGYCTSNNCNCNYDFSSGSNGCLQFPSNSDYDPVIEQSTAQFGFYHLMKGMYIYNMTIEAVSPTGTEVYWTYLDNFNRMTFTFQSFFRTNSRNLPSTPSYISDQRLGIVEGKVTSVLIKYGSGTELNKNTTECSGAQPGSPVENELFKCQVDLSPFNYRLDSGDVFSITFRAKNGGYRVLTPGGKRELYTGRESTKIIHVKFDKEKPYHCSEQNKCGSGIKKMLDVGDDVTKNAIQTSWDGWIDDLSTVKRYALEVFRMEPNPAGQLQEPYTEAIPNPVPLFIREVNESTSKLFPMYLPSQPGVYSVILEINDHANKSTYVRRFVLFDKTSSVTLDNGNRLYAPSANENAEYNWQTSGERTINLKWTGHFLNKIHEDGKFLNEVRTFKPALSDDVYMTTGGNPTFYKQILEKYDDYEGKRGKNAIPNERGIVKFDLAYMTGSVSSFADQPGSGYQHQNFNESEKSLQNINTIDGNSMKIWVKAYDILGNSRVDSGLLHFDSSPPGVASFNLVRNTGKNTMDFTSQVELMGVTDPHSGVDKIVYRFESTTTGEVSDTFTYNNPRRDRSYCLENPCDENLPTGHSFGRQVRFDFQNCWAMLNSTDYDKEVVHLVMNITNQASLVTTRTITISNMTNLRGVNDYFGPMDVRVIDMPGNTVKLMWTQAPSCYYRSGIMLIYKWKNDTEERSFKVHKDADWFNVIGLEYGTTYNVYLYTKYGYDEKNPIRSPTTKFTFTKSIPPAKEPYSDPGPVIGGVTGALLVVIVLVVLLLIFMVYTGRMRNPIDRFRHSERPKKNEFDSLDVESRPKVIGSSKRYDNRAYSKDFDDDVYYAQNETPLKYQISRHRVTFEEEIVRGKFAVIYKAKFSRDNTSNTVVAKTLKDNPTQSDVETMNAKVNFYILKIGDHPNVLKFIGVVDDDVRIFLLYDGVQFLFAEERVRLLCTCEKPPTCFGRFMVLEYCENGTLKEYLNSKKNHVNDEMHEKLYRFSCSVCKGMNYLASQGVVHRRLAARNILLTFLLETKITGFGPEPKEETSDDKNERVPIKWAAPECIKSSRHATEKSDVWSYGVLLWEIFSMGDSPYAGIRSMDLAEKLKKGERLQKPEHCDDTFYKIMKKCWSYEDKKRPNFEEILDQLHTLFTGDIEGDDYYYSQGGLYDNRQK